MMGNRFSTTSLADRFWRKVQKSDGCWIWMGANDGRGYGSIREAGRGSPLLKAHRVSWLLHFGDPPRELCVLHRCDNPPCVNPGHLFLGTLSDNSRDAAAKGRLSLQVRPERACRAERHRSAKLTTSLVRQIRALRAEGWTQCALAERFRVSQAAISLVLLGRTWRSVA